MWLSEDLCIQLLAQCGVPIDDTLGVCHAIREAVPIVDRPRVLASGLLPRLTGSASKHRLTGSASTHCLTGSASTHQRDC